MPPFFSNLINSSSFPNFSSFGAGPAGSPEAGPSTSSTEAGVRQRPDQRRQLSSTSTTLSVAGLSVAAADDDDGLLGGEAYPRSRGGKSRPTSWAPSTNETDRAGREGDAIQDKERRRRRKRVAVETFIIVKPPPASSKNPLNLQIQLVMRSANPSSRSRARADSITGDSIAVPLSLPGSAMPSPPGGVILPLPDVEDRSKRRVSAPPDTATFADSYAAEDDADKTDEEDPSANSANDLTRSMSLKSSVSGTSSKSAMSSSSSVAGGRRIVPLYNLSVHSVMHATVVTDAGTDARVAKFQKRSLDIAGIGSLEPTEIWPPSLLNSPFTFAVEDQPISRPLSLLAPLSPTSTRGMPVDESSPLGRVSSNIRASLDIKRFSGGLFAPHSDPAGHHEGEGSASKKLFGRMFKKKDASPYASRKSPVTSRTSLDVPGSHPASPGTNHAKLGSVPAPSLGTEPAFHLAQPTFGTAPLITRRRSMPNVQPGTTLASAGNLALPTTFTSSRAIGYTWSIRRWDKRNLDGWANHLVAAANAGLELVGGVSHDEADGEVVFEWIKLRPTNAPSVRPSAERQPAGPRARSKSRGPSNLNPSPSPAQSQSSLLDPVVSPSPASRRSASPAPSRGEDDSDPEDSETPWTCTVWVKGTGQKQLLATLTPAPHHPKVVGVLKVPMDLSTVPLTAASAPSTEQREVAKRVQAEVALTEENLKDVVCVTAMWLVVREEFGGLGKRRKT